MGSTGKVKDSKINEFNSDGSITMSYVRINNGGQVTIPGMDFGQQLEPSGEYMQMDTMNGKYKVPLPNYEYGTIHFDNPLLLEFKSTNSNGWKKDLSEMYKGKKKKALSNAIMKDGYDAVITYSIVNGERQYEEIVNLKGKKK